LDLNARELPIRPDIVGATLSLEQNQRVKLTGPEPLAIQLQTIDNL
jgi:pyrimidine operon attenuation protein/uracil phosphoribosyltransferase